MSNTDLSKFRFQQEGFEAYAVESDLKDFGGAMGPTFIAPVAFVVLDDGQYRWVLKRGFAPLMTMSEDGWAVQHTSLERAERLVRKVYEKGAVDLTLWEPWTNIFTSATQPTQA